MDLELSDNKKSNKKSRSNSQNMFSQDDGYYEMDEIDPDDAMRKPNTSTLLQQLKEEIKPPKKLSDIQHHSGFQF